MVHPLDGKRKWGISTFYLLPFLQMIWGFFIQNTRGLLACWNYLNTVWAQLVQLAQLATSKTVLNMFTSLPLLLACWIDGIILLYAIYESEPPVVSGVLFGCLITLVMIDASASVIQQCSNNYCSNWYMYKIAQWLKNSVVDKRIRPWTVSNFLMNFSIVLIYVSSVRVLYWHGAFSISLVATISVVFGKKDDMGVTEGLVTCYYLCTLTFPTTRHDNGIQVSLVSLAVLIFILLCTVGSAADPKLKTVHDEERRALRRDFMERYVYGDDNGDFESLQREISGLREELRAVKAYCQQPKSRVALKLEFHLQKAESTLVVGKSGAYLIRGFSNFARNCFFNAVVQVLLCIAPLRVPFMKLNHDGRDQDTHEFLLCLLQLLQEEEEKSARNFPNSPPFLVNSIFGGRFLNTTSCNYTKCEYPNEEGQPFLQMLLPIPVTGDSSRASMVGNTGSEVSLTTCLDQYIQLEFIPDWRCTRCGYMGGNYRTRVIRAPLILTISFGRFNAKNEKINDYVLFEETFDLQPYTDPRFVASDKLEYHLIGVVVHEGSVDTGHCFAYVRGDKTVGSEEDNKDFTWYCLNDSVVHEVSLQQVLESQAYMLFYEKKDSPVKQGLGYATTSSALGPPATPSGYYENRSEPGLGNYRTASISNHGSSKQRHRRSISSTSGSGKQVYS
ncbi:hypothetical protein C5167_044526 [Papaver somniferum]|uniref:USP domain-containing protein n=1 Tax=Papaver somniferum TaxID=3469 RepID=A0A4Y7LBA5_PAPSO|nr:hypothetical protein C5167_044526 [Papaver somniferum]